MTPDKIKEAFEGYLDNFVPRVGSVDDSMKRLELERRIWPHWQACAEWMLSQASDGFESWFLESHGYKPEQLVIPESVNPLRKAFIAARLSSAKEIEFAKKQVDLISAAAKRVGDKSVELKQEIAQLKCAIDSYAYLESTLAEKDEQIKQLNYQLDAFGGWLIEVNCPPSVLHKFREARELNSNKEST